VARRPGTWKAAYAILIAVSLNRARYRRGRPARVTASSLESDRCRGSSPAGIAAAIDDRRSLSVSGVSGVAAARAAVTFPCARAAASAAIPVSGAAGAGGCGGCGEVDGEGSAVAVESDAADS
jgi:hypothetical protein